MKEVIQGRLFPKFTVEKQQEAEAQIVKQQQVVDYQIREYPIEVIVQKYIVGIAINENEIFIPKYQRKFVWDLKKQSKFIESLILGLPIPYIFAADKEGRMEIVDGSQRVRTLEAFFNNKLELEGLKKLKKLNGFKHSDLDITRQRRFNKKTIRIIELTERATWEVRKDMFERINTSPTTLTDMEVRKGVYEGPFIDFVKECTNNIKFKMLCPISKKRLEREEASEMVLRFFAYAEEYEKFVHIVRDFVDNYMETKQQNFDITFLSESFENMLDFVESHFPHGFTKTPNAKSTPRVRFEAISVGVHLALQEKPDLIPTSVNEWINSEEFKYFTKSDAANNRNKVVGRFEYVRDKLLSK